MTQPQTDSLEAAFISLYTMLTMLLVDPDDAEQRLAAARLMKELHPAFARILTKWGVQ